MGRKPLFLFMKNTLLSSLLFLTFFGCTSAVEYQQVEGTPDAPATTEKFRTYNYALGNNTMQGSWDDQGLFFTMDYFVTNGLINGKIFFSDQPIE